MFEEGFSLFVDGGGEGRGSPRRSAVNSLKIQGLPIAPRAIQTPSTPVVWYMRKASAAVKTSPEPKSVT